MRKVGLWLCLLAGLASPVWGQVAVEVVLDQEQFLPGEELPVAGSFDLDSAERATKHVEIAPYFSITQPGRYAITATVRIKQWGQTVTSRPNNFNVMEGAR